MRQRVAWLLLLLGIGLQRLDLDPVALTQTTLAALGRLAGDQNEVEGQRQDGARQQQMASRTGAAVMPPRC